MTNREQAQKSMFNSLDKELDYDETAYEGNDDFEAEVVLFKAALADNNAKAAAAHEDNSGFSAEKLKEKIKLSDKASNLSGKSYVKFINLGRQDLADLLHKEPTDYTHVADSECATLALKAYTVMHDNLSLLSPNTITDAMLIDFQKEIDKFNEIQGSSETVHAVSPKLTQEFKDSFKPVMTRVDHLKYLIRDYKTTNLGFYDRLMASTKIPVINVHHTYVEVHVVKKSNNQAIAGAVFTLTNGKKSATSNWEGIAEIEEVKKGNDILTGVLNGTKIYEAYINIKSGTVNHYEVVAEAL